MIAKDALVYAQQGKRKTLQRKDLGKWYKDVHNFKHRGSGVSDGIAKLLC